MTDLVGGQYVLLFATSAGTNAHIKSGRLRLLAMGAEPVGSTPEEFTAFIKAEAAKWSRVMREAGISLNQ